MAVTDLTIEMVVAPRHHQGQSEARVIHPGAGVLRPRGLQGRQLYRGTGGTYTSDKAGRLYLNLKRMDFTEEHWSMS